MMSTEWEAMGLPFPKPAFLAPVREAPRAWRPSAMAIRILAGAAALLAAWLLVASVITLIAAGRIGAGSAAVSGAGNVIIGLAYGLGLFAAAAGALLSWMPLHHLAKRVWQGRGTHSLRLGAFVLFVITLVAPALTVLFFITDLGVWFFATIAIPLGVTAVAVLLVITAIFWLLAPPEKVRRS